MVGGMYHHRHGQARSKFEKKFRFFERPIPQHFSRFRSRESLFAQEEEEEDDASGDRAAASWFEIPLRLEGPVT